MEHDLQDIVVLLAHHPRCVFAPSAGIVDAKRRRRKDSSVFDILGHLIHGEPTDCMPRARMIVQFGESKAFAPFDRLAQERESQGKSLAKLLEECSFRTESLDHLRDLNLRPEDLARRGRHPALDVVTLSQLLAACVVHDLTHLHQISRVMGHQYRNAVGPWSKYLAVLECAGRSSPA